MSGTPQDLSRRYRAALKRYLHDGGEAALSAAYEVGRMTVGGELGILDVTSMHQEALASERIQHACDLSVRAAIASTAYFAAGRESAAGSPPFCSEAPR